MIVGMAGSHYGLLACTDISKEEERNSLYIMIPRRWWNEELLFLRVLLGNTISIQMQVYIYLWSCNECHYLSLMVINHELILSQWIFLSFITFKFIISLSLLYIQHETQVCKT
jgi:hypothetical protein